jgi:hypothetical protein
VALADDAMAATDFAGSHRSKNMGCQILIGTDFGFQKVVWFLLGGHDTFWQSSLVVLGQPILPLQELSQISGLYADFYAAKAGEQEIHFVSKAGRGAKVFCGRAK